MEAGNIAVNVDWNDFDVAIFVIFSWNVFVIIANATVFVFTLFNVSVFDGSSLIWAVFDNEKLIRTFEVGDMFAVDGIIALFIWTLAIFDHIQEK